MNPWSAIAPAWSVALEEDVLVVQRDSGAPSRTAGESAAQLAGVQESLDPALLRLATAPHARVGDASAELTQTRIRLESALRPRDMGALVTGTHPFAGAAEPTLGLRVRVALPDGEAAVRASDGLRRHLPALLAVAGNSPFRRGRDTGFASSRAALLSNRPGTGIPPAWHHYAAYLRVVAALSLMAAPPRWDVLLQPSTGMLEVRLLDGQTRVADAAALAALVQCLVRMHADPLSPVAPAGLPRILDDNRLAAARNGIDAALVEDRDGSPRPVRLTLEHLVDSCLPVADELGCVHELIDVTRLMAAPGAERQRAAARRGPRRSAALQAVVAALNREFAPADEQPAYRRLAA